MTINDIESKTAELNSIVSSEKFIAEVRKRIEDEIKKELVERFSNIISPEVEMKMKEAINRFYDDYDPSVYNRSNTFGRAYGLFDISITDNGNGWKVVLGNGFPTYPVMRVKGKWSRPNPWPGDEAWSVLFIQGIHGHTSKVGKIMKPSPDEIVYKFIIEKANEIAEQIAKEVDEKRGEEIELQVFNKYLGKVFGG